MKPVKTQHDQWAVLAGLRFILASIVLFTHIHTQAQVMTLWGQMGTDLGGFAAVLGFLVVSGYSIAASVGRGSAAEFYQRRFWRIYPVYFMTLLVIAAFWLWHGPTLGDSAGNWGSPDGPQFAVNAALLQIFVLHPIDMFQQSWTLSLEVALYAFAPLVARLGWKPLLALVLCSVVLYVAHAGFATSQFFEETYGISFLCLAWPWLLGFLYYRERSQPWAAPVLVALAVGLVSIDVGDAVRYCAITMLLTCGALIYAPVVPLMPRAVAILEFLGDVSYPLYVIHIFVIIMLHYFGGETLRTHPRIYIVACYAAAVAVLYLVDKPGRAYGRWRMKSTQKHDAVPAPNLKDLAPAGGRRRSE